MTQKLSLDQKQLLIDVLDWWLDGIEPARAATERDQFLDSPEILLEAMAGMEEIYLDSKQIRILLLQSMKEDQVAGQAASGAF